MYILNSERNLITIDKQEFTKYGKKIFNKILLNYNMRDSFITDGNYTYSLNTFEMYLPYNMLAFYSDYVQSIGWIKTFIINNDNCVLLCFENDIIENIKQKYKYNTNYENLIYLNNNIVGIKIDNHSWNDNLKIQLGLNYSNSDKIYIYYTDEILNLNCYEISSDIKKVNYQIQNVYDFVTEDNKIFYFNDIGIYQINKNFKNATSNVDIVEICKHSNIKKFNKIDTIDQNNVFIFIDENYDLYFFHKNKKLLSEHKIVDFIYENYGYIEKFSFLSKDGYVYTDMEMIECSKILKMFFKKCSKFYVGPGSVFLRFDENKKIKSALSFYN